MHHHPYAADAILRPSHPPPAPASSAAPTKAFLAARVCLLTPRADGKECNHTFASPAMLVSLAVVVAEPGGITRSTTATLVHQPMYHSALRFGGPSHILGREALQCGGIASLATDTWLPTAAIERWARDAIDGVVWCATDSAAWQWSRSPGSLPSDIPLSQTATSALRVPTLVYHQSGLCFCPGALRWRVGASSNHKGFAARCNDALESPHAAYSKPVTSIVLVDFDDDAFSCPSFFGGRMYGTVSRLAQAQGLPHTCEGDEFRACGSQCHSELVDAALQPATCWVAVNGAPSTAFANALGVSVDEFTAALSTMERAALNDARAMSRLVKAYCDPATLEDYAHCPNPMTRRLLSTPAMQDFAKRAFASPFNTDACRTKTSSEAAALPSDSADSNWIRQ